MWEPSKKALLLKQQNNSAEKFDPNVGKGKDNKPAPSAAMLSGERSRD